ncbi:MAG: endo alpha-1,4 polygalactosaminidase [Sphaerochaeta sp.]|nr:endo alpha-1,4 polygalactosaminidase [Sphaerochaeta sp.]
MNIVEASFFEKEDVEYLHKNNSQVVGYLSLVEIGHWNTPLINDLHEEDYLVNASHEKMKSLSKTNYLGDLSSPHFSEILFTYLESRILDKGMDGVFFDTLDWIDYYADDARIYEKLTSGYKAFLIELRQRYPDIIVIQNRGFESYKKFSHDYIDGILWENFKSPYIEADTKKIQTLKEFDRSTKLNRTNVFVISFENEVENRKTAKTLNWNFLFSQMDNRYSEWDIVVR